MIKSGGTLGENSPDIGLPSPAHLSYHKAVEFGAMAMRKEEEGGEMLNDGDDGISVTSDSGYRHDQEPFPVSVLGRVGTSDYC